LPTRKKRNGRIERQKRASSQYERLQAWAGGYSEAPGGEHYNRARGECQAANSRRLEADKGGDEQISTATRILAEVIASDASWLMVFNGAIDHIIQNNPKARQNPRGLSQLDGYKRGLVNSLTGNLQKFGLDRVPQVKTLEDLLQDDETSENPTQDCPETMNQPEVTSWTVIFYFIGFGKKINW
jgi:hypothetical protein